MAATRRPRVQRGYVRAESEDAFQTAFVNLAVFTGWRCYHPPDNRPSRNTGRVQAVAPGFPDWTLVRAPRLVFAELKAEKGRVRPEQIEWLDELRATGAEAYLWRPSDWKTIERLLAPERN